MIKVVIADDHAMIREGIKNLIEFDGQVKVIGEAATGKECIDVISRETPDVLLLDINMPEVNGLEVLKYFHEKSIRLKVLVLTIHNEIEYLIEAINIGAKGYILKDSSSSELLVAINIVYKGEEYIQPSLIPKLNQTLVIKDIDKDKIEQLTKREMELLIMIAKGNPNKDIARKLDISERTVKNHISSIFKKIEVNDRTQAAVFAIKNNLIKLN